MKGFEILPDCMLENAFVFLSSKKTNHDIQAYFGNARTTSIDKEE